MSDFAPGDVVVCVNARPCSIYPKACQLREGAIYRVTEVCLMRDATTGLKDWAVRTDRDNPTRGDQTGWSRHSRFRKIDKADEGFSTWMRSLLPIRERQNVRAA